MMGEIKGCWGDGSYYLSCVSPEDADGRRAAAKGLLRFLPEVKAVVGLVWVALL